MLRISSGADAGRSSSPEEVLATVSQEEAAAIYAAGLEMDKHAQLDAHEIELLKSLLVEQEQQVRRCPWRQTALASRS
jgi:heterodisulfide reductase subunit A-like polyferredoxin